MAPDLDRALALLTSRQHHAHYQHVHSQPLCSPGRALFFSFFLLHLAPISASARREPDDVGYHLHAVVGARRYLDQPGRLVRGADNVVRRLRLERLSSAWLQWSVAGGRVDELQGADAGELPDKTDLVHLCV